MNWGKNKLADICISIADGDHQPPPKADSGIPFVTISNITNTNKFDFTSTMFVPQEYYDTLDDKRRAQVGDVLYSVVGSFGIPVLMGEEQKFVFQRHIAILRPDREKIVPAFLFYTMLSRDFYMKADAVALGAAQRTVSLSALRNMEIEVPPYEIQEKIVNVLKPYDELIENNQKQIKLLEEAAQRLYKEWFVDLRFPNYEECRIVDGIPEGWKKVQLRGLGEIITGKTPSTANSMFYGGNISFVKIPDMHAGIYTLTTEMKLTDVGANVQKNKFIPKNSIMVSCIGTAGLVSISCENCQTNQQINSIVLNKDYDLYYVYLVCSGLKDTLKALGSNGATMTNVNKEKFGNITIIYPTKDLIVGFNKYVEPIFEKIYIMSKQVIKASENRDRLLPKLMNGEIEV